MTRRIRGRDVEGLDASVLAAEYTTVGETIAFVIIADASGNQPDPSMACGYHGPPGFRLPLLRKLVADLGADERMAAAGAQ